MRVQLLLAALCFSSARAAPQATASASASTTVTGIGAPSATAGGNGSVIPTININGAIDGALNATAWALIYTYPLYIFANFAGNILRQVSVNQIYHQRQLASPDSPGVIKPNIDTVYSRVVLDLSQNDVVLTIPNISDGRYWDYPVLDLFGNVIAEIGIVNNNTAGKYLIRRASDTSLPGYEPANYSIPATTNTSYAGVVNLPTSYGTMLIRLFVKQNTTADLNQIHIYQNASSLANVTRTPAEQVIANASVTPSLTSLAPNGTFLGIQTPLELLNLSAKLVLYNPPENLTDLDRVSSTLAQAGLYSGEYYPPAGVNLTYASAIANATIQADITNSSHIRELGNNWEVSIPSFQGNYGTNYGVRAYIAVAGYQEQTVRQTLYPGYKNLGFSSIVTLQSNTSALFTFSGKPPLNTAGFWSLSVYGSDQYLIPNALNRFEVGERSTNLTYQDGSGLVYGPNANVSHDGPFQVLVQNANATPPANWTGNWIPGDSTFSYILRWYVPQNALTNGSYVYPTLQTIAQL